MVLVTSAEVGGERAIELLDPHSCFLTLRACYGLGWSSQPSCLEARLSQVFVCLFVCLVGLGLELRASLLLGKCFTT
jgi:hypothetical protein